MGHARNDYWRRGRDSNAGMKRWRLGRCSHIYSHGSLVFMVDDGKLGRLDRCHDDVANTGSLSRSSPFRWTVFDDRQNRIRNVAGKSVRPCWTVGSTIIRMWLPSP